MNKKTILILFTAVVIFTLTGSVANAFWVWTPKSKKMINPKTAVKDSPREQFDWSMQFFRSGDFKRAAEEFVRLTDSYPDSDLAPDAQYYAARSYEEEGKYLFAYQNYQKAVDKYPYTKRMEDIIRREYNIANIFEQQETAKFMEIELSVSMERAAEIYAQIVKNSPFSTYADKSLYKLGEVLRRMMKYNEAMEAYERLINDYPDSDLLADAKYQLAYTRYEASLSPEYDQETTDEALKEFQQISKTTDVPAIADEAQEMMTELRQKKAASTLKIAEFYDRQGKSQSAILYYKDVVGKFAGTDAAKTAQDRINKLEEKVKK